MLEISELVLCAIALILLAPLWFNGTSSARSYTTAARYYSGLLLYTLILVGAFLVSSIALLIWLESLQRAAAQPFVPLAALLFVTLIVRLPVLAKPRAWLRRALHRVIGSPGEAERLSETLQRSGREMSKEDRAEVTLELRTRGYDPSEEVWLPVTESMRGLWFKSAALFHKVRLWSDEREYCGFVQAAGGEYDVLRRHYDQLSLKVARVLDTVDRLGGLLPMLPTGFTASKDEVIAPVANGAESVRRIVTEVVADLREDIAFFQRNLCIFVARGVLAGSLTAGGRRKRLSELGFVLGTASRSPIKRLILVWAGYGLILLFFGGGLDWLMLLMIPTITLVSLATAVFPKRYFGFANQDLRGRTPWLFVVASGLASATFWIPTRELFYKLSLYFHGRLTPLSKSYPWVLTAVATAAMTAYLIQDNRWSRLPTRWIRRALDGMLMAIATTIGIFGSIWWLSKLPDSGGQLPGGQLPMSRYQVLLISVASGLLAGVLVPGRVRRRDLASPEGSLHNRPRLFTLLAGVKRV